MNARHCISAATSLSVLGDTTGATQLTATATSNSNEAISLLADNITTGIEVTARERLLT